MPASSDDYLNPKQELFCKFMAQGETQLNAYTLAGYTPSSSNANTLAQRPAVKQRIKELKKEHERKELEFEILKRDAGDPTLLEQGALWTFQRVMDLMGENVRLAQIAGEYKAATECLKLMGESMKMFDKATDPKENSKQPNSHLTFINKVVQELGHHDEDGASDNPLAPRKSK